MSLEKCIEVINSNTSTDMVKAFKTLYDAVTEMQSQEKVKRNERGEGETKAVFGELLVWLRENGGVVSGKLEIDDYGKAGNGVMAMEAISEGELLFQIPEKLILTEGIAEQDEAIKFLQSKYLILRKFPTALLAVFLLMERQKKKSSFWKPYIDSLPDSFSIPLYWTWEDLLVLKGTSGFSAAYELWKNVTRLYILIKQIVKEDHEQLGRLKHVCFHDWKWAMSVLFTRQNGVPKCDSSAKPQQIGDYIALIPGWDMCNHEIGKSSTAYDTNAKQLVCCAMRDFDAKSQVFMYYGNRSNAAMLVNNGFLPHGAEKNPADYVVLRLSLNKNDPKYEEKKGVLTQCGLPSVGDFAFRHPFEFQPNCNAMLFCRLAMHKGKLDGVDFSKQISVAAEIEAVEMFRVAMTIRLKQFESTAAQDAKLLKTLESDNKRNAIRLRILERSALEKVQKESTVYRRKKVDNQKKRSKKKKTPQ